MDQPLRSVVYIADIGNVVVLMVRRRPPQLDSQESQEAPESGDDGKSPSRMTCHVFESEDVRTTE